jgi:hypothetical protein
MAQVRGLGRNRQGEFGAVGVLEVQSSASDVYRFVGASRRGGALAGRREELARMLLPFFLRRQSTGYACTILVRGGVESTSAGRLGPPAHESSLCVRDPPL